MTDAEIEADRAAEQRAIRLMLLQRPAEGAWYFYRSTAGMLCVEGLSVERADWFLTIGTA